jgi:hypothetical protein
MNKFHLFPARSRAFKSAFTGPKWLRVLIWAVLFLSSGGMLFGVTLKQLEGDPKLTPKRFANYFSNFRYEFHPELQPAEVFLKNEAGDCDDYAVLADRILHPKSYTTRLIFISMPAQIPHVVCYVDEEKGYLDYNNRGYWIKIEKSPLSLRAIATKVAKSFSANWTSASEFTIDKDDAQHFVRTISKTDSPRSAAVGGKPSKVINVDF